MKPIVGIIVGGVGVVIVILATVLGWVVVPDIIDKKIVEQVRLVNNSETWEKWQDIPIPIYLKFHIQHITNPEDVENGKLPIFEEKGPYAYREERSKVNIVLPNDNIVRYEERKTYWYDEANSCTGCSEDDKWNIINVAFISVIAGVSEVSPEIAIFVANFFLGTETLVLRNIRVGDLTFNGFDVSLYTRTLGPLLPEEFDGGRFGLYKGMNASTDGVYEVYTGVENTNDFGMIKTWNGQDNVDQWWKPGSYCAMINGTDGSIFPPFVEKSRLVEIFNVDLCRSLYLTFEKEIEFMGVKGYRFIAPREMLEDPRINEDNQCFCPGTDIEECTRAGALSVSSCRSGAPIIMSTPHFYDGYVGYITESNMSPPVKDLHETYIDIEPHTGVAISAHKRIQVNMEIKKIPGVLAMKNFVDYMVFPLIWADEEAVLNEKLVNDIKSQLLTPLKAVNISKWVLLAAGVALVGIGIGMFIMIRRRQTDTV